MGKARTTGRDRTPVGRTAANRAPRSAGVRPQARRVRKYVPRDERRRQILEVAAGLFARHGFAGTTTRAIAGTAGTSETVLFRHFPTKLELYSAILEHQVPARAVEQWVAELRSLAARDDDEGLFGAVVGAILESFRRDATYHRLMLFAALEGHELARMARERYEGPIVGLLREYVARRQAAGAFGRARPEWVVQVVLGAATHYAQSTLLGVNPLGLTDREVAAETAALVAGLRGPAAKDD